MTGTDPRQPAFLPEYPDVPGARPTDTSMEAADSVANRAETMRDKALEAIRGAGVAGATADEIAAALETTPFTARPRVAELNRMGLVRDTGRRRANASGRNAIVWEAVCRR